MSLKTIIAKIETLAASERVTKGVLAELSREMVQFLSVENNNDIAIVNRLLSVLTPANKRAASGFFNEYLPFNMDSNGDFGKKIKGDKKVAIIRTKAVQFISNEASNIWTWLAEQDAPKPAKEKDYAADIAKLVKKALTCKKEEDQITAGQVMASVLAGGIELADLIALMNSQAEVAPAELLVAAHNANEAQAVAQ